MVDTNRQVIERLYEDVWNGKNPNTAEELVHDASVILLESMLERAGFDILESTYDGDFYAEYVCEWDGRS